MRRAIIVLSVAVLCTACSGMSARDDLFRTRSEAARAYADGDMAKAERLFRRLTETVPGEAEFWFRLGNVYARTHRPEEAIGSYREALLRDSKNVKAWHNMGIVHIRQAGNAFTQMVGRLPPEDPMYDYAVRLNEHVLEILDGRDEEAPLAPTEQEGDASP